MGEHSLVSPLPTVLLSTACYPWSTIVQKYSVENPGNKQFISFKLRALLFRDESWGRPTPSHLGRDSCLCPARPPCTCSPLISPLAASVTGLTGTMSQCLCSDDPDSSPTLCHSAYGLHLTSSRHTGPVSPHGTSSTLRTAPCGPWRKVTFA